LTGTGEDLFAVFSSTVWNFKAKFYILI